MYKGILQNSIRRMTKPPSPGLATLSRISIQLLSTTIDTSNLLEYKSLRNPGTTFITVIRELKSSMSATIANYNLPKSASMRFIKSSSDSAVACIGRDAISEGAFASMAQDSASDKKRRQRFAHLAIPQSPRWEESHPGCVSYPR